MYEHTSEHTVVSKTIPGVSYTIFAPSFARRMNFDLAIAEFRSQTRLMNKRYAKLQEEARDAERAWKAAMTPEELADVSAAGKNIRELEKKLKVTAGPSEERADIISQINHNRNKQFKWPESITEEVEEMNQRSEVLMATHYNAPRIRIYLRSISGLVINGKEATIDSFLADGPPELFVEILGEIDKVAADRAAAIKNLQLPTTSSNPVDGPTLDTTATSAEPPVENSTETATADATSPTT